jgi:hypothetical protein
MSADNRNGLVSVSEVLSDVNKEITRRVELRHRLEAEGVVMTDAEFIVYADRTGLTI